MKSTFRQVLAQEEGNYILPFFWQHGESEEVLREYMGAIDRANIKAVCVESRPHPDFCGPKWWQDMDVVIDEAKKRDMKVWILDDSHFPTGYANGAVENADKELCHQYLAYRKVQLCGPASQCEILAEEYAHPPVIPPYLPQPPAPKRVFHDDRLYGVIAWKMDEQGGLCSPVDLTGLVKDGKVIWDMPEGYWEVYILYLTRDARGRNDYINLLDRDSCRILIDAVYEPHYARYGNEFGKTIAGFFSDETPMGNTDGYTVNDCIGNKNMVLPWSKEMPEELSRCWKSQDWVKYLPLLWMESKEKSLYQKFRAAYMDAVTCLVSRCFSQQNGEWCAEHGVEYIGHIMEHCDIDTDLGPCVGHFFRGIFGQHMAGIDNIGGQVIPGGKAVLRNPASKGMADAVSYQYTLGKLGVSAASIDPKKKGRCMCENIGAYGWQCGVSMQKYLMNHFLSKGVNYYVPHAFSPAPFPDPDCPPHFYAHGKNPQYRAFAHLMKYTNRICHLIQGGVSVPDVAVVYHGENAWTGEYQSNMYLAKELTKRQMDFHIIPSEVFEERDYYGVQVERDALLINKVRYKALIFSRGEYIPEPAARFVGEAVKVGFPVFFTDAYPEHMTGAGEKEPKEWSGWKDAVQSCAMEALSHMAEAVGEKICTEVRLEQPFQDISVYHYRQEEDIFLLMNENPWKTFTGKVLLNTDKRAVQYDADKNCCYALEQECTEHGTEVKLTLNPLELAVLVCTRERLQESEKLCPDVSWKQRKLKNFCISRTESENYPKFREEKQYEDLPSMARLYPDFSGYYRYSTEFELQGEEMAVLKLDEVYDTAEIFLNGKSLGMCLSGPFCMDLTPAREKGVNKLVIEAATTMERLVHSMGEDISCLHLPAPLMPAGLLGEVTLFTK